MLILSVIVSKLNNECGEEMGWGKLWNLSEVWNAVASQWILHTEAATGGVLEKSVFLKISQNSQENN